MKPLFINFDNNSSKSLYVQLYEYLKREIMRGEIKAGERLPSLRSLADQIGVSITTCSRAYDQLLLEGYIDSRPQSGYYVLSLLIDQTDKTDYSPDDSSAAAATPGRKAGKASGSAADAAGLAYAGSESRYLRDPDCFDFVKWKKCAADVITNQQDALLYPSDPQGEFALRSQISEYLYRSRGVDAGPEQIVISAGVQQLTNHLARILSHIGIDFVNAEDPGYKPVRNIFRDRGFTINNIPVHDDGIDIEKLPINLESAVYVSPSNQFPTGSVMPVARRYSLLKWARDNGSIIIEDDYDSELRYFGDPLPALKSLDEHGTTVYLGSFSSTLFPAIRISYMALPEKLAAYFNVNKDNYDQTCSKIEQLTLALFMERGYYQSGIRKLRKLYAKKLSRVISAFSDYGGELVRAENTRSGINIRLQVRSVKTAEELLREAGSVRLHMALLPGGMDTEEESDGTVKRFLFYYDQIPIEQIEESVKEVCRAWAEP